MFNSLHKCWRRAVHETMRCTASRTQASENHFIRFWSANRERPENSGTPANPEISRSPHIHSPSTLTSVPSELVHSSLRVKAKDVRSSCLRPKKLGYIDAGSSIVPGLVHLPSVSIVGTVRVGESSVRDWISSEECEPGCHNALRMSAGAILVLFSSSARGYSLRVGFRTGKRCFQGNAWPACGDFQGELRYSSF